jgi:hypothetical protein
MTRNYTFKVNKWNQMLVSLGDRNHLIAELAPNSGLLGPPLPRNQRVKKKEKKK